MSQELETERMGAKALETMGKLEGRKGCWAGWARKAAMGRLNRMHAAWH